MWIKIGLKIILVLIIITVGIVLWVNHQMKTSQGGFTELLDPTEFVQATSKAIIKNVSILSADCTNFISNKNVVIEDGTISDINQDTIFDIAYEVIDGAGKYLIPGLVDSHVHLRNSKNDLLLYLANGITYVREMSGNPNHLTWKDEIVQGAVGPKMYVASEKVNSTAGIKGLFEMWTRTRINYASKNGAAKKIKQLSEKKYDALKIGSFINEEMYYASLHEANKYRLPAIGHIPYSIGLDGIYTSGQKELAHVEEITKLTMQDFGGMNSSNAPEYLAYLKKHSDEIAIKIRDKNIAVSTTIWLMESLPAQNLNLESIMGKVKLGYVNPAFLEGTRLTGGWLPGINSYEASPEIKEDPERRKGSEIFWQTYVEAIHIMTRALVDNGVLMMAGTDANGAMTVPGFSLHDELVSMADLGMSNAQVLYAATAAPGKWMNSNTGKVEIGYKADLVLLTEDPLQRIQHTTSVESVFFGGYHLPKNEIDRLLADLIEINDATRNTDISIYLN